MQRIRQLLVLRQRLYCLKKYGGPFLIIQANARMMKVRNLLFFIPGLPGHNWANAISMATPIAHKGATAGAKVQAMTMVDLLLQPALVEQAWDYFKNVQTKAMKYEPLIRPEDKPAIDLNKAIMERYRPELKKYYYDPSRYKTYLEQLGITYPTVKQ